MLTEIPTINNSNSMSRYLKNQLVSSKYGEKIEQINSSLMDAIYEQIQTKKLVIPKKQKPFKLKTNQEETERFKSQMSHIIQKKQQMQKQFKQLEQEHKLQLSRSRNFLGQSKSSQILNNNSNVERMFRSQITEQQKQKIKQVIKKQKQFIKQVKIKEKQHYEMLQQDKRRDMQIEQNMKKQKCQQRRQYWEQIRQQISKRQQARKVMLLQEQKKLKDIKKSKKLYEVLQKSWSEKVNEDESQIKQATQHMRLNHKFDLVKITQHQKEYQKVARQRQQARQRSVEEFQDKVKLSLPRIPQSKFFSTLKEQQKTKKLEQIQKQRKRFQLNQRKAQFAQKVRQNYKPTIDENLQNSRQQKVQRKQGLLLGQIRNLGNDYMRKIHKNVAVIKVSKGQDSKLTLTEVTNKPVYKNYLSDLKQRRNTEQVKSNLTNEVTKIMKNSTYSSIQKIQRAKLVAKRLQTKQNKKSSSLIESINQKMNILKILNQE